MYTFKRNAKIPCISSCNPQLDSNPELYSNDNLGLVLTSIYLNHIGILLLTVYIGNISIFIKVVLLSQYQANLRILYIGLLYHVFVFLNKYPNIGQLSYVSNTKDIEEAYFSITYIRLFLLLCRGEDVSMDSGTLRKLIGSFGIC